MKSAKTQRAAEGGWKTEHMKLCCVFLGQVPKESEVMLEDLSLYVLLVTAHAQWDYG